MKLIAVGDIHGRKTWQKVLKDNPDFDKFVFVGDYFDAFPPMTAEQIFETFKEILAFKQEFPDKVELVMGNHDFQYTPFGAGERYSGYNPKTAENLKELGHWWNWLNISYQHNDMLFTHAGLTNTWAKRAGLPEDISGVPGLLDQMLRETFVTEPELFRFYDGDSSHCGENVNQGPLWVRPKSLLSDMYPGGWQVVGHTGTGGGLVVEDRLIMIDTGAKGQYLKVEDDIIKEGDIYFG